MLKYHKVGLEMVKNVLSIILTAFFVKNFAPLCMGILQERIGELLAFCDLKNSFIGATNSNALVITLPKNENVM